MLRPVSSAVWGLGCLQPQAPHQGTLSRKGQQGPHHLYRQPWFKPLTRSFATKVALPGFKCTNRSCSVAACTSHTKSPGSTSRSTKWRCSTSVLRPRCFQLAAVAERTLVKTTSGTLEPDDDDYELEDAKAAAQQVSDATAAALKASGPEPSVSLAPADGMSPATQDGQNPDELPPVTKVLSEVWRLYLAYLAFVAVAVAKGLWMAPGVLLRGVLATPAAVRECYSIMRTEGGAALLQHVQKCIVAAIPASQRGPVQDVWTRAMDVWNHPVLSGARFAMSVLSSMANMGVRLPAMMALGATVMSQVALLTSQVSMIAPLLLGAGMLLQSVQANASLIIPRIGLLLMLLWGIWFATNVIQNTWSVLTRQGRLDSRTHAGLVATTECMSMVLSGIVALSALGVNLAALLLPATILLALLTKDLLANMVAGIYLYIAQPFRVGDAVSVVATAPQPPRAGDIHLVPQPPAPPTSTSWFDGICEKVDLRYTVIRSGRRRLMVPNASFITREFVVTDPEEALPAPGGGASLQHRVEGFPSTPVPPAPAHLINDSAPAASAVPLPPVPAPPARAEQEVQAPWQAAMAVAGGGAMGAPGAPPHGLWDRHAAQAMPYQPYDASQQQQLRSGSVVQSFMQPVFLGLMETVGAHQQQPGTHGYFSLQLPFPQQQGWKSAAHGEEQRHMGPGQHHGMAAEGQPEQAAASGFGGMGAMWQNHVAHMAGAGPHGALGDAREATNSMVNGMVNGMASGMANGMGHVPGMGPHSHGGVDLGKHGVQPGKSQHFTELWLRQMPYQHQPPQSGQEQQQQQQPMTSAAWQGQQQQQHEMAHMHHMGPSHGGAAAPDNAQQSRGISLGPSLASSGQMAALDAQHTAQHSTLHNGSSQMLHVGHMQAGQHHSVPGYGGEDSGPSAPPLSHFNGSSKPAQHHHTLLDQDHGMHSMWGAMPDAGAGPTGDEPAHALLNGTHSSVNGLRALLNSPQPSLNGVQPSAIGLRAPLNGVQPSGDGLHASLNGVQSSAVNGSSSRAGLQQATPDHANHTLPMTDGMPSTPQLSSRESTTTTMDGSSRSMQPRRQQQQQQQPQGDHSPWPRTAPGSSPAAGAPAAAPAGDAAASGTAGGGSAGTPSSPPAWHNGSGGGDAPAAQPRQGTSPRHPDDPRGSAPPSPGPVTMSFPAYDHGNSVVDGQPASMSHSGRAAEPPRAGMASTYAGAAGGLRRDGPADVYAGGSGGLRREGPAGGDRAVPVAGLWYHQQPYMLQQMHVVHHVRGSGAAGGGSAAVWGVPSGHLSWGYPMHGQAAGPLSSPPTKHTHTS